MTTRIGGKGNNLAILQTFCRVPYWTAVPVAELETFLGENGIGETIGQWLKDLNENSAPEIAATIKQTILSVPLPARAGAGPNRPFQVPAPLEGKRVAVRSSAADEDGNKHSFAGIHESYLYISGDEEILNHIRKVWASGYDHRALLYRLKNGLPLHPVPMAVIVQEMVDAVVSGVVFTADPTTGCPHKLVISALYGLGEGLVGAGLDADQTNYDKRTRQWQTRVACKTSQFCFDRTSGQGVCEQPVPQDKINVAALNPAQVESLIQTALAIETHYGRPQDIEFALDAEGTLFILQSRDITTVKEYGPAAGNRQIWDNSNIIESYSGPTSPMTFSFIRHAYTVVYYCFSQVMGIPAKTVEKNRHVYENMLGLFQGQVYYNLVNWYKLIQQFPGYEFNKGFLESMMGVKDTLDDTAPPPASSDPDSGAGQNEISGFYLPAPELSEKTWTPAPGWLKRYGVELPKLLWLAVKMLIRFMHLRWDVPAFDRHFNRHFEGWNAMNFDAMPPHQLMAVYHEMEDKLLRNWKTPIVNDFYVMVFYGVLKACCQKWCGDQNGSLQNNLICGEGDIASTAPAHLLMRLAARVKRNPAHLELVGTLSPAAMLARIPQQPDMAYVAQGIQEYLERYGFRCMNELKLEEPSLHETPEFVYQLLANYVRMDDALLETETMLQREASIRAEAETEAFARLNWIKRPIFRFVLKHARAGVKNRENMRFARTKIYGRLRQLLNAVGGQFAREGILDRPENIYYLTIDEVWDYVKGTAVTTRLQALATLRKAEFSEYRNAEPNPDDHFETYGLAYHKNLFRNPEQSQPETDHQHQGMRGTGCSPGLVEGQARVIHSPRDNVQLNGEILVAGRTDPGWVPLYPSVSGILIERGSILSHSAIVAREMGIPAIVGIPNLLANIQDGTRIRMDGTSGTIEKL